MTAAKNPGQNQDKASKHQIVGIAHLIDHTCLKADATEERIDTLCDEAVRYGFCSVCVNSSWVPRCRERLAGRGVKVCTVVGFPLGAMSSAAKAREAEIAVAEGADEVDMVINLGALKDRKLDAVTRDIAAVRAACTGGTVLKVIIEACLLDDEEKVLACECAVAAGADFVKTSTGFSTSGATIHDVALMRRTVGPDLGVKAAGGMRTAEDAAAMVAAGATRLGTSAGPAIAGLETAASGKAAY